MAIENEIGRWPTLFLPHGGGPCFFMDDPKDTWTRMGTYLRGLEGTLGGRPKAILVISAHWLESVPTIHAGEHPSLLYDYYGFPEHTYDLTWPAPGSPVLADHVGTLLAAAGIENKVETSRGWDHGVFVPFKVIWPEADIPTVQLSLRIDADPAAHLALGHALSPLRDEGVLIVGSGMSYHNLSNLRTSRGVPEAKEFDAWLTQTVSAEPDVRERRLIEWRRAPGAVLCHPEGGVEHLLPLHVAAGAAGNDIGRRTYSDRLYGKAVSAFQFG